jgi:branched-chain amino acid transport system substrate-binding protein
MRAKLTTIIFALLFLFAQGALADNDTIEVGVLASLTGNWAEIGKNIQQGVTLAGEEMNAKGGVLGKKLKFNVQDTDEEKSGAKVVSAYRFLQGQGINFFIGPTGVPGIMALTPLAAKDDMILVAPTSTNSFHKTSPKFFNASGDNYITTKAAAQRAYDQGLRQLAIFGSLQPWENDQANIFDKEFTALGGTIVAKEFPGADQTDLRIESLRIMQHKPAAVFFANFNQSAHAAKALRQLGFSGAKFAALLDASHIAASDGALDGTQLYLFDPAGSEFIEKFTKRFGTAPGLFADSAYDAAYTLATAINAAASADRQKVISALHATKFPGSSGNVVSYDAEGLLARDISLHEVIEGKLVKK